VEDEDEIEEQIDDELFLRLVSLPFIILMASFTVFDDASAFGYIMDLCASLGVLLCVFSLLIIGDLLFVVVAADELELEFEFSSFNIIFVIVYFYFCF